jgi:hypothetical protein
VVTPTIPSTEPKTIIRGDTVKWTRGFSEYLPADSWVLTYYFVNTAGRISVVASDNGDGTFLTTISSTVSKQFQKGRWYWQAVVTKAAERFTLDSGEFQVKDGIADATSGLDTRTWARRTLDAVEATLEGRATSDHTSMSINGRSISRMTPLELMDWRDRLRSEVRIEEQAAKAGLGRNIKARYGRG